MNIIPTGSDIKGGEAAFGVKRKLVLAIGEQTQDFGMLLKKDVKVGDRDFPLVGWVGADGKNMPVVAEYVEAPGKSKDGEHDLPSLKLFCELDGALIEFAAAFKRVGKSDDSKVFHTGQSNFSPKMDLTFWPIVKKSQE